MEEDREREEYALTKNACLSSTVTLVTKIEEIFSVFSR